VRPIEDVDQEAFGSEIELDAALLFGILLEQFGEILGYPAQEFEVQRGRGIEVALLFLIRLHVLVRKDADGLLGS